MTTSTPTRTPIEPPSIGVQTTSVTQTTPVDRPSVQQGTFEFAGMYCYIVRDGDHVTGRVEFPPQFNRQDTPIDYRSTAPQPGGDVPIDKKLKLKLDLVQRYQHLVKINPDVSKSVLAARIGKAGSVRRWLKMYELHGIDGLRDKYVKPIKKLLVVDPANAKEAMMICMWWSWRINNSEVIDTPMMTRAAGLLNLLKPDGQKYNIDDVLKTIECYYEYDTNRSIYPFKIFAKWSKYDYADWYFKMIKCADIQASRAAAKARKRDTNSSTAKTAISKLSKQVQHRDPVTSPSNQNRQVLVKDTDQFLRSIGFDHAADQVAAQPGSIMAEPAASLHDAMVKLESNYRSMLFRAARGEQHARKEASATFALWWPDLQCPETHNIQAKVEQWCKDHNTAIDSPVAQKRITLMFYQQLNRPKPRARKPL